MDVKKTKLTESQIENILTAYPEILEKVLQDFLKVQIINKHFEKSELRKTIDLQIQEKILPTLQIRKKT